MRSSVLWSSKNYLFKREKIPVIRFCFIREPRKMFLGIFTIQSIFFQRRLNLILNLWTESRNYALSLGTTPDTWFQQKLLKKWKTSPIVQFCALLVNREIVDVCFHLLNAVFSKFLFNSLFQNKNSSIEFWKFLLRLSEKPSKSVGSSQYYVPNFLSSRGRQLVFFVKWKNRANLIDTFGIGM